MKRVTVVFFALLMLMVMSSSSFAQEQDIEIVRFERPTLKKYPDIPKLQQIVEPLYRKIMQIKKQPLFVERGFGAGYPEAHKWMQECEGLNEKIKNFRVPDGMKEVGTELVKLGMAYLNARRKGFETLHDLDWFEDQVYDSRVSVSNILYIDVDGLGCE